VFVGVCVVQRVFVGLLCVSFCMMCVFTWVCGFRVCVFLRCVCESVFMVCVCVCVCVWEVVLCMM